MHKVASSRHKNKTVITTLRFSAEEYKFLKQQAEEAYLTVSEYARRRLINESIPSFDKPTYQSDPKAKFACDHDREMMRFMLRTYIYTREFVKESIDAEKYKNCNDLIASQLKEWGYE